MRKHDDVDDLLEMLDDFCASDDFDGSISSSPSVRLLVLAWLRELRHEQFGTEVYTYRIRVSGNRVKGESGDG